MYYYTYCTYILIYICICLYVNMYISLSSECFKCSLDRPRQELIIALGWAELCPLSCQVPAGFTAVMSANEREHRKEDNSFLFRMEKPIPSYLVALAVGELVSAEVGPR